MNVLVVANTKDAKTYEAVVKAAPNTNLLGSIYSVSNKLLSQIKDRYHPHVIIFDTSVPHMKKNDLMRVLGDLNNIYPYIKLIVFTQDAAEAEFLKSFCFAVIDQPVTNTEMNDILRRAEKSYDTYAPPLKPEPMPQHQISTTPPPYNAEDERETSGKVQVLTPDMLPYQFPTYNVREEKSFGFPAPEPKPPYQNSAASMPHNTEAERNEPFGFSVPEQIPSYPFYEPVSPEPEKSIKEDKPDVKMKTLKIILIAACALLAVLLVLLGVMTFTGQSGEPSTTVQPVTIAVPSTAAATEDTAEPTYAEEDEASNDEISVTAAPITYSPTEKSTEESKLIISATVDSDEVIKLSPSTLILDVDQSYILNAQDNTGNTLKWSSSDDSVATVDQDGKVKAVGGGSAYIVVSNGEDSDYCLVAVNIKGD